MTRALRAALFVVSAFFIVSVVPVLVAPVAVAAGDEHAAGAEHGGEHGDHGLDPKRLALQLLNFAVLAAILGFFGGKAINKALASRHEQMKRDLEEAAQARTAAEGRLAHQERRMANLEKEIAALRASIKEEAVNEEQRLVAAAEEKARRIQDETRFLLDQQVKEAELRFRAEVAGTAVRVAEEMVRRSVQPEDTARLQQSFIADLENGAAQLTKLATSEGRGPDGRLRWFRGPALRPRPVRPGQRQEPARGVRRRAGSAGGDLRRLARAAPDPGEPGVQACSSGAAILDKLLPRLAPSREVRNFALLLLERGRISALPAIARAYQRTGGRAPGAGAGDR